MEKDLIEVMRKMSKEMDKVMNGSQENAENRQELFNLGFQAGMQTGIKYMMDKIEKQYELGKPILANDNLYWLKGAKENLRDIMDDIEAEYKEITINGNRQTDTLFILRLCGIMYQGQKSGLRSLLPAL